MTDLALVLVKEQHRLRGLKSAVERAIRRVPKYLRRQIVASRHSIRFKTTLLYSGILCAILLLFGVYLHDAARRILTANADEELVVKADQITSLINAYAELNRGKLPSMSLMGTLLSGKDQTAGKEVVDKLWEKNRWLLQKNLFQVINSKGEVVLRSENFPPAAQHVFASRQPFLNQTSRYTTFWLNGTPFRQINYSFTLNNRSPAVLQLAVPMTAAQKALSRFVMAMAFGIVIILSLSLFVGSFLTRKILRPVQEVTRTASAITQKNLGVRIPSHQLDREMKMLVHSFNDMISRLERSFGHVNEFSSHVAHELKTPLAIIKGELELALSSEDRTREEDARVMEVTLQETDRLIKITKDMLLLAKFEYNLNIFQMEKVNLTAFLADVAEHSKVLAQSKQIRLDLTLPREQLIINGDSVHLRRLFFNLIHNAVKFTPANGLISLRLTVEGATATVEVSDTGEGIPLKDQPRIFDKFYRSRESGQAGTGLGLCLAQSIAHAHGGEISFNSRPRKGTTFFVSLPLQKHTLV